MRRVWVRRAAAVATSLGLGGCLVVNGAFEPAGGGGSEGSSSSGAAVVTEGSGTSTGSGGPDPGTTEGLSTEGGSSTGPDACAGQDGDLCAPQPIGDHTYLICEREGTWEEARSACEARCARLVILDEAESKAIFDALRAQMTAEDMVQDESGEDSVAMTRASWWIGGHKVGDAYQWLDGTPMPAKGMGGWGSNDPDIDGAEGCAVLGVFAKGDANGKWFDRSCVDVPYRSICEPL